VATPLLKGFKMDSSFPNDFDARHSESALAVQGKLPDTNLPEKGLLSDESSSDQNSPSQRDRVTVEGVLDQVSQNGSHVFLDQYETPYAYLSSSQNTGPYHCFSLESKRFRYFLLNLIWSIYGVIVEKSFLNKVIDTLKSQAITGGIQFELFNRFAVQDQVVRIDMCDADCRMIEVSASGWNVIPQHRPLFYRASHQLELPDPETGGQIGQLYDSLGLQSQEERLLVVTWMISALHPGIISPILVVCGSQGSGKTTLSRRIRSLIDPSSVEMLGNTELSNLTQTFSHHAVPCFENVGRFSRNVADMFCRAVTGTGIEKRKLFTDSDPVLYSFRRAIIINGIDLPSTRSDFLERCLVIERQRLNQFASLQQMDSIFEAQRPRLMGVLFDILSNVLNQENCHDPAGSEFRMSDFAILGRKVAIAMGLTADDFDRAYQANLNDQSNQLVEDCVLARCLLKFAEGFPDESPWEGTATELLKALREKISKLDLVGTKDDFPKSPRWLSVRLDELAPYLHKKGILVRKEKRTSLYRRFTIRQAPTPLNINAESINAIFRGEQNNV